MVKNKMTDGEAIQPPPLIKATVIKTADYVYRNGPDFENLILQKRDILEKMRAGEYKQEELIEEESEAKLEDQAEETAAKQIVEPPNNKYKVKVPMNMDSHELEVIKLTAQFVARNGKQFLNGLSVREAKNPLFDFIRPLNPFFSVFTQLVDAYSRVLILPKGRKEDVARLGSSDGSAEILNTFMNKLEWESAETQRKKKEDELADEDGVAYSSIDWHNFTIVATVTFDDVFQPQKEELAPNSLVGNESSGAQEENGIANKETPEKSGEPSVQRASLHIQYQICPRCNQRVPISEMAEHMRIELLNPKWRDQKEVEKKNLLAEENLAREEEISKTLKRFAERRADIFGGEEVSEPARALDITSGAKMSISNQIAAVHESRGLKGNVSDHSIGPKNPSVIHTELLVESTVRAAPVNYGSAPSHTQYSEVQYSGGGGGGYGQEEEEAPSFERIVASSSKQIGHTRPPMEEESTKRRKQQQELLDESTWIEKTGEEIQLSIEGPDGSSHVINAKLTLSLKDVKGLVSSVYSDIPPNKMKLQMKGIFVKDSMTLAYYNAKNMETVEVTMKKRGGRR